jgi:hypothetical protein
MELIHHIKSAKYLQHSYLSAKYWKLILYNITFPTYNFRKFYYKPSWVK